MLMRDAVNTNWRFKHHSSITKTPECIRQTPDGSALTATNLRTRLSLLVDVPSTDNTQGYRSCQWRGKEAAHAKARNLEAHTLRADRRKLLHSTHNRRPNGSNYGPPASRWEHGHSALGRSSFAGRSTHWRSCRPIEGNSTCAKGAQIRIESNKPRNRVLRDDPHLIADCLRLAALAMHQRAKSPIRKTLRGAGSSRPQRRSNLPAPAFYFL